MEQESFLEEGEVILEKARKHWIVYVEDVLAHTFTCLVFIIVAHYIDAYGGIFGTYSAMAITLIVLVTWVSFFYAWTQEYFDVWYITDRHIVVVNQKELLDRQESFMEYGRIQDVSYDKVGLLQTWLGYGKLHVQSAGSEQEFTLENVHDVEMFAHKIMELRDQVHPKEI